MGYKQNSTVLMAGAGVTLLAGALGFRALKSEVADDALEDLNCIENYLIYNQDAQGGLIFNDSPKMKAMYAAVVNEARSKDISIEEAAKNLKNTAVKRLASRFSSLNNTLNLKGRIISVSTVKDDGIRLVKVGFCWTNTRTAGSGDDARTYKDTEYAEVFIPVSEANQYGVDDVATGKRHSVSFDGDTTFEFDEATMNKLLRQMRILERKVRVLERALRS